MWRCIPFCMGYIKAVAVMKVLERCLARLLNVVVQLLPRARDPERGAVRPAPSRSRAANPMQSQWRVYRLYAADSRLLLRGETGRVICIGAYAGAGPALTYTLGTGAQSGPWASLPVLLANAAQQLTAARLERTLAQPGEQVAVSADLDRGPYLDVSLFLRP